MAKFVNNLTIKDSLAVGIAFIMVQNSTNKPVTINLIIDLSFP